MISSLFHTFFYDPIYNLLVFLVSVVPHGDVGLAVIGVTILVRLVLLPFSLSASRTQRAMKVLEPKLKEIKEQYKDDKQEQAAKTMELYKTERVNPFASIVTLLIQMPVLFALYFVFLHEPFPQLNAHLLYTATPVPETISLLFLGIVSVLGHSIVLAVIAAAAQYYQVILAVPKPTPKIKGEVLSTQEEFTRMMGLYMRVIIPVLIGVVAYTTSGAVALYFITGAVVSILQELYIKRQFDAKPVAL
ncbi:MAG: YidC/Oxa1 family membrane protein insertase [bacterium]